MRLAGYAARRAAHTAVTLALLLVFMFVLFRLVPGDPTTLLLGTGELTLDAQQRLRAQWGLDQSMLEQFLAMSATSYVANSASRSTSVGQCSRSSRRCSSTRSS